MTQPNTLRISLEIQVIFHIHIKFNPILFLDRFASRIKHPTTKDNYYPLSSFAGFPQRKTIVFLFFLQKLRISSLATTKKCRHTQSYPSKKIIPSQTSPFPIRDKSYREHFRIISFSAKKSSDKSFSIGDSAYSSIVEAYTHNQPEFLQGYYKKYTPIGLPSSTLHQSYPPANDTFLDGSVPPQPSSPAFLSDPESERCVLFPQEGIFVRAQSSIPCVSAHQVSS